MGSDSTVALIHSRQHSILRQVSRKLQKTGEQDRERKRERGWGQSQSNFVLGENAYARIVFWLNDVEI